MYPVFLRLEGQPCLVVGGGAVAERKVRALLAAGASVRVVSPTLNEALAGLAREGRILYVRRGYRPGDLAGVLLVVAATASPALNTRIARECRARRILVNVVNAPEAGNFLVPAVLRRGALVIAVSTGGKSPLLARILRDELAARYGPEYAELPELVGGLRKALRGDPARREEIVKRLATVLREKRWDVLEELMPGAHSGGGSQPSHGGG